MRALLVNTDSTIPNLFLMKMSAFAKGTPDGGAGFSIEDPTHAYISCILRKNRYNAISASNMIRSQYPDIQVDVGGTGVDILKSMPEVDLLTPDYSLYPEMDYSMGFTTRGCIRKCPFCFVPKKEGKFRIVQHPTDFHEPKFKKMVLLDNNILARKDWFFEVTDWMMEKKLAVDFNQGLDARLMDSQIIERLAELRWIGTIKTAFDNMAYKDAVLSALDGMKDAGIRIRNVEVYVYCDSDRDYDDAVERCRIVKERGAGAYAMLNIDVPHTARMRRLKRWTDRKQAFFGFDIADYRTRKGKGVLADGK